MENREWPLVTLFTLVYNTGKFVTMALDSVLANKYPNLQHIIIDDCSTDGESVQTVQRWIDEHKYPCTFIKHEQNQGICKSLNEILSLVKGKYMLGISDDLLTETRIADHVTAFEEGNSNVAIVYGDVALIDSAGKVFNSSLFKEIEKGFGYVPSGKIYYDLLRYNFIPAVGVTLRTKAVRDAGGFDENLFFEDWDMWLRLSKNHEFRAEPSLSAYYRRYSISTWNAWNVKNYECGLLTLDKNVSDKTSRKLTAATYHEYAEYYYKLNGKNSFRFFLKALSLKWTFAGFIFMMGSFFGFSYQQIVKYKQKVF